MRRLISLCLCNCHVTVLYVDAACAHCRSTTIALALAVALLLLVLITSLVVLYIKHRRIYSAYSQVFNSRRRRSALRSPAPHTSRACASCS